MLDTVLSSSVRLPREAAIEWISLEGPPAPVRAPDGLIYSTAPKEALATNGAAYIIKGPGPALVFSEYAAYELAGMVGIPVPEHALCTVSGLVHFASRKLRYRFAPEDIVRLGHAENADVLGATAAFDIWIANDDRNVGNFVANPGATQNGVRLYAIDFEGAHGLRGVKDQFTVATLPVRSMMPKEPLGAICRRQALPQSTCDRIADGGRALEEIITRWNRDLLLPQIDWSERACTILRQRSELIHKLVREAWA